MYTVTFVIQTLNWYVELICSSTVIWMKVETAIRLSHTQKHHRCTGAALPWEHFPHCQLGHFLPMIHHHHSVGIASCCKGKEKQKQKIKELDLGKILFYRKQN